MSPPQLLLACVVASLQTGTRAEFRPREAIDAPATQSRRREENQRRTLPTQGYGTLRMSLFQKALRPSIMTRRNRDAG